MRLLSAPTCNLIDRVCVILVPSYLIAYLTEKMVYVVPMVAATLVVSAALAPTGSQRASRVDEDGAAAGAGGESGALD